MTKSLRRIRTSCCTIFFLYIYFLSNHAVAEIQVTELYEIGQGSVALTTTMLPSPLAGEGLGVRGILSALRGAQRRGNLSKTLDSRLHGNDSGWRQGPAPCTSTTSSSGKISTSSSGLTGGSLAITNQYVYSPYGIQKNLDHAGLNSPRPQAGEGAGERALVNQTRVSLNIQSNPFGYTGQAADPSTSLMMLGRFRNYASGIGRFIQPDIYNSFSKHHINNPMAYVVGNPLKLVDPTGHTPIPGTLKQVWDATGLDLPSDVQGMLNMIRTLPEDSPDELWFNAANVLATIVTLPDEEIGCGLKAEAENLLGDNRFKNRVVTQVAEGDVLSPREEALGAVKEKEDQMDMIHASFLGTIKRYESENVLRLGSMNQFVSLKESLEQHLQDLSKEAATMVDRESLEAFQYKLTAFHNKMLSDIGGLMVKNNFDIRSFRLVFKARFSCLAARSWIEQGNELEVINNLNKERLRAYFERVRTVLGSDILNAFLSAHPGFLPDVPGDV